MVCEEAPQAYSYGARPKAKNRFIGGVVTPAQPQYLHGMVDDRADTHDFQEAPPILGIATAVGGYKVQSGSHILQNASKHLFVLSLKETHCLGSAKWSD